ncbi:MAG: bifunctional demethylmenaquinone methyltransferase/2-methoxy-6-polyprenyl-1,4-benzoquinol methylase UbiE [Phycisphaerae bacterium]
MTAADETIWDDGRLVRPHDQPDKARRVREMFDRIAPTYEHVNRWLSAGRDAYWRRRAVELTSIRPSDCVLDVACGTGDFARTFEEAGPKRVVGADFSERMLALAPGREPDSIDWCRADALSLPFSDASYSVVSCAFGVRNFQDPAAGLREMHRILRPGGRVVILEFSTPRSGPAASLYSFYFHRVLPKAARWISGDRSGAYDYLPKSVSSFLDAAGMIASLKSAGFARIETRPLSFGIVRVFVAVKESRP